MDRGERATREVNPRARASLLSLLSFSYTIKLFIKGFGKGLETSDIYEVLDNCRSEPLGDDFERQWLLQRKSHHKRAFYRALWACFGKTFMVLGLLKLIVKTTITIWSPEALSKLISYFSPEHNEMTKNDAIFYGILVLALNFVNLVFEHNYNMFLIELGIRVRTAICSVLYRKSLKLSGQSLSETSVGKITTIITRDIDGFESLIICGHDLWIGAVQTIVICYLIYCKIGIAALAGVSFFLLIVPFQVLIGKVTYSLRLRSSKKTDERLELIQETLSAIKVIKMYTWEKYFINKINMARKTEMITLQKIFYTTVLAVVIGGLCSKIAFFLFVMTYVWLGNSITAELVYFIMSCFNNLEYTLGVLVPYGISYVAQVSAAVKRVVSVLEAKELQPPKQTDKVAADSQIVLKGVTTKAGDVTVFDNICFSVSKGLNVLVGHVGSGKTTLFKVILQEYDFAGDLDISGKIAYASQEPWLFPSSIKNNILFGEDYCEKRYQKILDICALNYDLDRFTDGDRTIVGDRGVNLSKGQQARINLARAIYRRSDIYLLDDCLAALDANVSDYIFKECMQTFLKDKLVMFITNNFNYIQKADRVITVNCKKLEYGQKNLGEYVRKETDNGERGGDSKKNSIIEEPTTRTVYAEVKKSGKVDMAVYLKYIAFGGGYLVFSLILGIFVVNQGTKSYSEKLMSEWVTLEQNLSSYEDRNSSQYVDSFEERTQMLNTYVIMVVTTTIITFVEAFGFFTFVRMASIKMHKTMVRKIVNGTMYFFDSNFIGNVLNRFSKDFTTVDEYLPFVVAECLRMVFVVPSVIILLASVNYMFFIQSVLVFIFAYLIRMFYQPTGRNLQRLDALTRSPMIGHINSTLEGLTTIRASKAQQIVQEEYDRHQNLFTSANYTLNCSMKALGFALELLCSIFIASIVIRFLGFDLGSTVGDVGLAITQAFVLTEIIITGLTNFSDCENNMTSVERIMEYIDTPEESTEGQQDLDNWPDKGSICLEDVSLSYSNQHKDMLSDINIHIDSNEKIGIVGRTGAGKSSIISVLLRLYETKGKIVIDGVDIHDISLKYLRSKIAVIPQDPFIFSGTIRDNFDPLHQHQDDEIWRIINDLKLKSVVKDLDSTIDKGTNFSAGQKQLICLARAILRGNRIVILDEATANVDQETDSLIHDAVHRNFDQCTVIIIAHRLLSVLNCHKIVVLNAGEVAEVGTPAELLQNKNSFLHVVLK